MDRKADGTTTIVIANVPAVKTEKNCTVSFSGGYLVFVADHFSIYVIEELDENGDPIEPLNYRQALCALNGHDYAETVTAPGCVTKGYTTHTCTFCGDVYTDNETAAAGHDYQTVEYIEAGCDYDGRETKECVNCHDKVTETFKKTGHNDADGDKYCDNCGKDLSESQSGCSHLCHKGGFLGFIWKIINFFNKLFKINQYCSCGAAHW